MAPAFIHRLARKLLHIDPNDRYVHVPKDLEARARDAIASAEPYLEGEPTVAGWLRECVPTREGAIGYVRDLFPSARWVPRYNLSWLFGDAIAGKVFSGRFWLEIGGLVLTSQGLTVGFVVVPQAMAYAFLAQLSPEHGLFTSFAGFAVYWIFGTSRDVVVGVSVLPPLLLKLRLLTSPRRPPSARYLSATSPTTSTPSGPKNTAGRM